VRPVQVHKEVTRNSSADDIANVNDDIIHVLGNTRKEKNKQLTGNR